MNKKFTVIVDTDEKIPHEFLPDEFCEGSIRKKIKTGDYCIVGAEDILAIERKRNLQEIYGNFTIDWKRFRNCLDRLSEFQFPVIVCEFPFYDIAKFPLDSGIPSRYWKPKHFAYRKHILNRFLMIKEEWGIEVIFAGSRERSHEIMIEIFKSTNEFLSSGQFNVAPDLYKSIYEYIDEKD